MKYPKMNWSTMEAIVNKLGGEEGVNHFLRDETVVTTLNHRFRREKGVIYLPPITSDGMTGGQWVEYFKDGKFHLGFGNTEKLILNQSFRPTKGVTYWPVILGYELFEAGDLLKTKKQSEGDILLAEALIRRLEKPHAEVACLMRKNFSNDEIRAMGLQRIIVMHKPLKGDLEPCLLVIGRSQGFRELYGGYAENYTHLPNKGDGYLFVFSQGQVTP